MPFRKRRNALCVGKSGCSRLARVNLYPRIRKTVHCRREKSEAGQKEEVDRLTSTRSIHPRGITSTFIEEALFRFLNGHHPSALK